MSPKVENLLFHGRVGKFYGRTFDLLVLEYAIIESAIVELRDQFPPSSALFAARQ